jgi:hypothetical protein
MIVVLIQILYYILKAKRPSHSMIERIAVDNIHHFISFVESIDRINISRIKIISQFQWAKKVKIVS